MLEDKPNTFSTSQVVGTWQTGEMGLPIKGVEYRILELSSDLCSHDSVRSKCIPATL